MTISKKIIITDTNIITDLSHAELLDKFVLLDNVYISDLIKNDEINFQTGNLDIINKFKVLPLNSTEILELNVLSKEEKNLSLYDLSNFLLAKNYNGVIATGDKRLKEYAEKRGIEVLRTLKIIKLLYAKEIANIDDVIFGCALLKLYDTTRIPSETIDDLINTLTNDAIRKYMSKFNPFNYEIIELT